MPPNNVPVVHSVEQVLVANPKGVETIFLWDLNARMGETRDERKEELATELADHVLEDIARNSTMRR